MRWLWVIALKCFLCAYVKYIMQNYCPVKALLTNVGLRLYACLNLQVCMTQTRPWVEASWISWKEELKDFSPTSKTLLPKSSSRWPGERLIQTAVKLPCGCRTLTSAHALLEYVLACLGFAMMHHFPLNHWQIQPNEGRGRSGVVESTSNLLVVNLISPNLALKQCHPLLTLSMFSVSVTSLCSILGINRFRGFFFMSIRPQKHAVLTWRLFKKVGRIIRKPSFDQIPRWRTKQD